MYDIPGPSTGSAWIDFAPQEHLKDVNESNKKPDVGDAKDLVRLIEAWNYSCTVPISSL